VWATRVTKISWKQVKKKMTADLKINVHDPIAVKYSIDQEVRRVITLKQAENHSLSTIKIVFGFIAGSAAVYAYFNNKFWQSFALVATYVIIVLRCG